MASSSMLREPTRMEPRRTSNTSAKFDGKDYPIIGTYADTVSVKRIDANTIQSTLRKKDGQLMLIVTTTVSTDGKTRNLDIQRYRWAGA
jgi:methionine synthase I (cobalamin-dependent)